MTNRFEELQAREAQYVLQTYKRQPVEFVRGQGSTLYDANGKEYLDFLSGIGVTSLGHAHPALTAALTEQVGTLLHTSNLYFHKYQAEAGERLSKLSGLARTFFCNSGAEANEACLKFARRYWFTKGVKNRTEFVAVEGAFAGRTMGALSLTWDAHYREPFQPLIEKVTFVSPDRPEDLAAAVGDRTAAVMAEPIRGEGGIRPLPAAFAKAVADVCERTGTLLIADEVQTGLGRTGVAFQHQALGWTPDLVSVGKALGSGVPVGAALVSEKVASTISAGDHGSTYGGNLLATRAASVVLRELMEGGLIDHVRAVGAHLERRLGELKLKHPLVTESRGVGLMRGVELRVDAGPAVDLARERGLLVNRTNEKVVRMLPPLTIDTADVDRAVAILDGVLADVATTDRG